MVELLEEERLVDLVQLRDDGVVRSPQYGKIGFVTQPLASSGGTSAAKFLALVPERKVVQAHFGVLGEKATADVQDGGFHSLFGTGTLKTERGKKCKGAFFVGDRAVFKINSRSLGKAEAF